MTDNNKPKNRSHFDDAQRVLKEVPGAVSDGYAPKIVFGATQGKKGHKAPRINMAFSPENHAWIKERSKQLGVSATELVNAIIENERLK